LLHEPEKPFMTARFQDISSLAQAQTYYEGLAARWPERAEVIAHLCEQAALVPPKGVVVELCAGGGQLAFPLLSQYPQMRYIGFDLSTHGIAYARQKLAPFADRVTLWQADLNQDAWLTHLPGPIDALLSLQSLHDLGDANAVARLYAVTHALLHTQGRWILADFLEHSVQEPASNPGRLRVEQHLAYFNQAGYSTAHCTLQTANFGCFVAQA
jgi:hypothetical protein